MEKYITIRKGQPEYVEDFARLALLSSPTLFPILFAPDAEKIMRLMYKQPKNLFSFSHSYFGEVDGEKAGMVIGYDWQTKRTEDLRTGLLLLKFMKISFFANILSLFKSFTAIGDVKNDEFYISNIAVYPKFQRLGLGTKFLLKMEENATNLGAKTITLDVEANNQVAINLYSEFGYFIIGEPKKISFGKISLVFLRMAKKLLR